MVQMAQEGKSRKEIEGILMERFGEETLGTPLRGDLVVGVTLVFLVAVALVWTKARSWVRSSPGDVASGEASDAEQVPAISEADRDRLEAELDKFER